MAKERNQARIPDNFNESAEEPLIRPAQNPHQQL